MTERDKAVYCPHCGRKASVQDKFCGRCGGAIPPNVRSAASAQTTPAQASANATGRGNNLPLLIGIGVTVLLVVGLGIGGTVAALVLLRGEPDNQGGVASPSKSGQQEEVGSGGQEATGGSRDAPEKTDSKPSGDQGASAANTQSGDAQEQEAKASENSTPAPGYNLIRTPDGSLSVEVPQSWGVETGEDSEKEAGPNTWSYYAGEYLASSITTAPNLDIWYSAGTSGAYMVAAKSLAQNYSDDELTHSLMFANKPQNCTAGPEEDYDRPPYSGTLQAWFNCGPDEADTYTIAAAPEGRECVVVLDARISDEADREAVEHLINTFEVDCGRVSSEELGSAQETATATASASASALAPAEPSASHSGSAGATPCPPGSVQNAAGNTCTDLATGEIVRETPLPHNPNTNPCPEMWTMNEQGRCEQIPLP